VARLEAKVEQLQMNIHDTQKAIWQLARLVFIGVGITLTVNIVAVLYVTFHTAK
jgi:hypothetical protein